MVLNPLERKRTLKKFIVKVLFLKKTFPKPSYFHFKGVLSLDIQS